MSQLDLEITNEMVIPTIDSVWFEGHDTTRYAIGKVAIDDKPIQGREAEFDGYLQLRANVYAYQTRMIPTDLVREDGTEIDNDDSRSTHWAIIEQKQTEEGLILPGLARVIGTIRTIEKRPTDDRPLPIEDFFPEIFHDKPLPVGAVEVSRYIARHEKFAVQGSLSRHLFAKVVGHIVTHDLGPTFGVVEDSVEQHLKGKLRVPLTRIAEPKFVEEYAAENLGIEVHIRELAKMYGLDDREVGDYIRATEDDVEYFNVTSRSKTTAA